VSLDANQLPGGRFLWTDTEPERVFMPEDFTEEHRMIAQLAEDFVANELDPLEEEMEQKLSYGLTVDKLRAAGELGLLGAEVPEAFGGIETDKVSALILSEKFGRVPSFFVSYGGQTGIGSLPIVFFGNERQKRTWLPDIVFGRKLAAYALTEASAGTDALGIRTTATLSEDGTHYVLNGSKQFISGSGFADLFIVFAKVNGTDFTAFIVERNSPGLTIGPEEKKMGLKGSSTCALTFDQVPVPVENVLGEVGRGHIIAFNILNIGRIKLGAGSLGLSKDVIGISARYANERKQFGKSLSSFPLIGRKLADMNIRAYALESMLYRTGGLLDEALGAINLGAEHSGAQSAKAIAEYALECSIIKVFGSETAGFAVDEGVQIHGGYGFTQEYRIERLYRDARIFRIFEGTNEINRMLIPGTIVKRCSQGALPLLASEPALPEWNGAGSGAPLDLEQRLTESARQWFRWLLAQAVRTFGHGLDQEQEICAHLADIAIHLYAMESVSIRARKRMARDGEAKAQVSRLMTAAFIHESYEKVLAWARDIVSSLGIGEQGEQAWERLRAPEEMAAFDRVEARRKVAARVIEEEKYVC